MISINVSAPYETDRQAEARTHSLVVWLFFRGLGLIYFAAFASMSVQVEGLIGSDGILPLRETLTEVGRIFPYRPYLHFPTVFWLNASNQVLTGVCFAGMAASVFLFLNLLKRTALIVCFALYLSIINAAQEFTNFQWDALLAETGFTALFLTGGSPLAVFLFRFLIARFMFMGGVVKLAGGDPNWLNLTALDFHYLTQPLPSPVAYYAYYLPQWFNKLCVAGVFVIELIIPFFVFLPGRFRRFAGWCFIALQSAIILTGNYNFFNLLTILLCLSLFDDSALKNKMPTSLVSTIARESPRPGTGAHMLAGTWMLLVLLTCAAHFWLYNIKQPLPVLLKPLVQTTSSLNLVNMYGPFAVMTTERKEIIVQGSDDGKHWLTYHFRYKPGKLDKPLTWNIPHQPRLDWQMWFAALSPEAHNPWFAAFMTRLLEGSPHVLSLLADNPFPEHAPKYVKALSYRYSFTTPEQRADTGRIWHREYLGIYRPAYDLEGIAAIPEVASGNKPTKPDHRALRE
ncbi:MAG: lipase maturation factor family protein [Gammaproteobacteria bacterium]